MFQSVELPLPADFGKLYAAPAALRSHKQQHTDAHALLEKYLPQFHIAGPAMRFGKYGKPFFAEYPDIFFNLSHCSGLAVCLFSDAECGADAEPIRQVRMRIAGRVFSDEELCTLQNAENPDLFFTRLWTLKEAYVKAIGVGVSYPMREVSFCLERNTIRSSKPGASFAQLLLPSHVVSVCVLKETETQPILRCGEGSML